MVRNSAPSLQGSLIPFFILTYTITWGLGAFAILLPAQFEAVFGVLTENSPLYFVAVAAPTISAITLAFLKEGWSGLGRLFRRMIHWRFGIQWYALVLVVVPILGYLVSLVVGSVTKIDLSAPSLLYPLLLKLLISGPLCEELGWRGFALPRLLKCFNPLAASLILGVIWGVWHLPSFFLSGFTQATLSLPIFLMSALCISILMTWIFLHTGGSVLIAVLFHYMVNFSYYILGAPLPAYMLVLMAAAILVLMLDKKLGWFRPLTPDISHEVPSFLTN
ncbi:MAG: CPBP family intramembrane metalloprotease [Chloroflexi bacterium]|nr:CPBP family intramembrane metalloprotease [Chloroflexota bacterium]